MVLSIASFRRLAALGLLLGLTACARAPDAGRAYNDPYEIQNRGVHEDNRSLDRALIRPAATSYVKLPDGVENTIANVSANLSLPGSIVNDLLQLNISDASHNIFRLLVNSTIGLGGLRDPATEMGLGERSSDFGETLHVWGAGEGNYVELPFLGPSTERDAVGKAVDLFTNPVTYLIPSPTSYLTFVAGGLSRLGERGRHTELIDSILYESADSYAQARLLYLENRRFKLGGRAEDAYADPYDDFFED